VRIPNLLALFAFLFLLSAQAAPPPSLEGHWEGTMVREGASLPVSFDFIRSGAELTARFNSPTQRALGIPLRNVRAEGGNAHFELVGDSTTFVFDGRIAGDRMEGGFREGPAAGTFSLWRTVPAPLPYREEEVEFRNGDVVLSGTLLLPPGAGRHPAVIFLHGSGGESRAASRFLADHFARRGIAALIYDKRGVGRSTGDWRASDFTVLADDGAAAIALLAGRPDIAPGAIGVYGHSQGGMLAPLLASRTERLAFLISAAGSAVPLHEAEVNSISNQLRAQGIAGEELVAAEAFIRRFVEQLRTGGNWDAFEVEAARVRGERWYPMLHVPARDSWFWNYYRNIANYDAALFWERVRVPALVVYGELDNLVPVGRSIAAIGRALGRAGNADHVILMLPRANHALNIEPEPGQPFEWWRLSPGYPELITAWINHRFGDGGGGRS
jgi:pimeloyl-ACP methyl ester carboxylesterase